MGAERGGGDKGAQVALVGVVVEGGWGAGKWIQRYTCWEGEIALVEVVVESEGGARRQIQGYTSCERNYTGEDDKAARGSEGGDGGGEREGHTHMTNTLPKIPLIASLAPLTTRDTKDGHGIGLHIFEIISKIPDLGSRLLKLFHKSQICTSKCMIFEIIPKKLEAHNR